MVPATRSFVPVNRMDALFNQVFGELAQNGQANAPLAMWADDDTFWVEAEMPGVAEGDVEITVHKDVMTIKAERKPQEGRRYLYNGRSFGTFERSIRLPEPVQVDAVNATLKDGVLTVELPKSAEAKPRKITLRNG